MLGLDIGTVRTGVARANTLVRLPSPLTTLAMDTDFVVHLQQLINDEQAVGLVIGLPRNLRGDDTQQTAFVRTTADSLRKAIELPMYFVDEALTSEKAEQELGARKKPFTKGDVDALAACYILEDALEGREGLQYVEAL